MIGAMSSISLRTSMDNADSKTSAGRKMKNTASEVMLRPSSAVTKSPRIHNPSTPLSSVTAKPKTMPMAASSTV